MRLNLYSLNLEFLNTLKGAVSLLRDPSATESVYDVEDGLRYTKATQLSVEFVKRQPGVAALVSERYIAPPPNLEQLQQCPPDSLGFAYAKYITDAGFDPNFYRVLPIEDDVSYIFMRLRQTHDIWHLVAGFQTDVPGELGLKAFELAQTHRTMAAILLAGGLLATLLKVPEQLDALLESIATGYRIGSQAQPFLAQKWEQHWEKSLHQWRSELGIPNGTLS
jgi:ubiquinone biosynthesis protein COQ4